MGSSGRNRRPTRSLRGRGLVVTEGKVTELEYFDLLKQELSRGSAFVHFRMVGVGKDPLQVLEKCLQLREQALDQDKPYDWACCVVDVDTHTTLEDCIREARQLGIHVVVSNVKFEVWLLWHVVDKRGAHTGAQLDRLMQRHSITDGKHLMPRFPIGKFESAVSIARAVDPSLADHRKGANPSSSIPILLELMR